MLHSTLPRAFLAPGLSYLGGYYGEDMAHPYSTTTYIPLEDHYSRIEHHHHHHHHHQQQVFPAWQSARSVTPCPLDLSLKPPPTPSTPKTEEAIEVDDEEDRRHREELQRRLDAQRCLREDEDALDKVDDTIEPTTLLRGPLRARHDYEEQLPLQEERDEASQEPHARPESGQPLYPKAETTQKYRTPDDKLLLASPTHLHSIQSYHQQLLLTPQHHLQTIHAPMTPPSTPSPPQCPRKRSREDETASRSPSSTPRPPAPVVPLAEKPSPPPRPKKKHARRLKFDEDTSSPVSGTVILGPDEAVVTGDIDPAFNIVEVTEEARAELAKIENRLGPYQCKLCRHLHEDAFQLAQHRCSRIAHVEYRCPECDKRFSCPANLASHRRWHKPRQPSGEGGTTGSSAAVNTNAEISCARCDAKFTRQSALRKHVAGQHPETEDNGVLGVGAKALAAGNVHLGGAPLVGEMA